MTEDSRRRSAQIVCWQDDRPFLDEVDDDVLAGLTHNDMTKTGKKEDLTIGRTLEVEWVAGPQHSAENFGNPGVPVFATPAVVWLLDSLAHQVIVPTLEQDQGTLGTKIDIEHLAATPLGMRVRARAEIVGIEGKRVLVKVEANDESEMIARGTIERYITTSIPRFLERTYAKRKSTNA